jgi:hypothetical protein
MPRSFKRGSWFCLLVATNDQQHTSPLNAENRPKILSIADREFDEVETSRRIPNHKLRGPSREPKAQSQEPYFLSGGVSFFESSGFDWSG